MNGKLASARMMWPHCQYAGDTTVMHKAIEMTPLIKNKSSWSLHWRHDEHDGLSNHQSHDCLFNHLFKAQIKENIKTPRHWPLWGELVTSEFPTQRASNVENDSIWWCHHDTNTLSLLASAVNVSIGSGKGLRPVQCQTITWTYDNSKQQSYYHDNYLKLPVLLGIYSLSGKTSYGKISWSLKVARFGFRLFQWLWNFTGTLAAVLLICL